VGSYQHSEKHVAKYAYQPPAARAFSRPRGSAAVGPTRYGDRLLAAPIPTLWEPRRRAQTLQGTRCRTRHRAPDGSLCALPPSSGRPFVPRITGHSGELASCRRPFESTAHADVSNILGPKPPLWPGGYRQRRYRDWASFRGHDETNARPVMSSWNPECKPIDRRIGSR
jgi:hypothetical protein